ncbi:MAG: hypothetical protein ACR2HF_11635 [Methylococcaceae bacterium]
MWPFSLFKRQSSRGDQDDRTQDRYVHFRRLGRQYTVTLIKQLPESALQESAKKLGLIKAGTFILNQDDEIAIAYDYSLHHHRRVGKNLIERTLETQPPAPNTDERIYLEAMQQARYSVFAVQALCSHTVARLVDQVSGAQITIMDRSLASTATPGLIVAGRLLEIEGFTCSSGTLIPIPASVYEARIVAVIRKFFPDEPARLNRLSPARSAAFEAEIVRIALHAEEDIAFYTDD